MRHGMWSWSARGFGLWRGQLGAGPGGLAHGPGTFRSLAERIHLVQASSSSWRSHRGARFSALRLFTSWSGRGDYTPPDAAYGSQSRKHLRSNTNRNSARPPPPRSTAGLTHPHSSGRNDGEENSAGADSSGLSIAEKSGTRRERGDSRAGAEGRSTFVSSHYREITEGDMQSYFNRKGLGFRNSGEELTLKECPTCPPHKERPDNLYKLYVSKQTGAFFCHRCGTKGSWFDLKDLLRDGSTAIGKGVKPSPKVLPDQKLALKMEADLLRAPLGKEVMAYLQDQRGLLPAVVQKYRVGVAPFSFQHPEEEGKWVKETCITFPWIEVDSRSNKDVIRRYKVRGLYRKQNMRLVPTGGQWGLFGTSTPRLFLSGTGFAFPTATLTNHPGWHMVPEGAEEIVITEGEFDAMAVYQATGMPAVSLPNGARSLPIEVLPMLERFKRIYLWMDDDLAGQEGGAKFARKLGVQRCFMVHSKGDDPGGPKDANEALKQSRNIEEIIKRAKRLPHEEIVQFHDLKDTVLRELNDHDILVGVKSPAFSAMNTILKGHRKGELTIFSGATGVGKTTFLSQLSLGYCQQGINTLWGSFEIKNTRLVQKMLCQHTGLSVEDILKDWDSSTASFSDLPLYFMRFFGSTNVEKVIEAMEHAAYVYDVEHVILDNLQFMTSGQGSGYYKFDLQDRAIEEFRKFASSANVHVTLVIHPRKEDDNALLSTSSVFGSAKATQEADNVILLQRGTGRFKRLDIKKNRFDGELGNVYLEFDKTSNRYKEVTTLLAEDELTEDSGYLGDHFS